MRCGCILLVLTVFCILLGIEGIRESQSYRKQEVMTYPEFVKKRPHEGWFKLKNCVLNVAESIYEESSFGRSHLSDKDDEQPSSGGPLPKGHWISKVWIPVHGEIDSVIDDKDQHVFAVLSTDDPEIIHTVEEMISFPDSAKESEVKKWADKNYDHIMIQGDLNGMISSGLLASDSDRRQVAKLEGRLDSDFVVFEKDRTPHTFGSAMGILWMGAFLGVVTFFWWGSMLFGFRRVFRKPDSSVYPPATKDHFTYNPTTVYARSRDKDGNLIEGSEVPPGS